MEERPGILAQLARTVADGANEASLPLKLCRASTSILDVDGGAITLAYTAPERLTVCVTDATADRLEDLQEVLGEGPGPDAYRSGLAVMDALSPGHPDRWPVLARAVRAAVGPVTIHAFPMCPGSYVLGVLTVYQSSARPLAHPKDAAQLLANAVGTAILGDQTTCETVASRPWSSRDRINQATGMIVAQMAISPSDALSLLRAHAFATENSLDQVARDVVERRRNLGDNIHREGNDS